MRRWAARSLYGSYLFFVDGKDEHEALSIAHYFGGPTLTAFYEVKLGTRKAFTLDDTRQIEKGGP